MLRNGSGFIPTYCKMRAHPRRPGLFAAVCYRASHAQHGYAVLALKYAIGFYHPAPTPSRYDAAAATTPQPGFACLAPAYTGAGPQVPYLERGSTTQNRQLLHSPNY
jgi:hypothetical protein